jgi:predicted nucleic acid-binding protein
MKIVVSDTSPIINLAMIGRLSLLPAVFNRVIIPQKVFEEIVFKGSGLPDSGPIPRRPHIYCV